MTLTTEWLSSVGTILGALFLVMGFCWRWFERRVTQAERIAAEAKERSDEMTQELAAYKLKVSETFAHRKSLKEVEERLVREIDGLRQDLKGVSSALVSLPDRIADAVAGSQR